MLDNRGQTASILLFSQDPRLGETRKWVLEKAGFPLQTVQNVPDLERRAAERSIALFILCNSLSAELRRAALLSIEGSWPVAKVLVLTPVYPIADLNAVETFNPIEGPRKLIDTVRRLVPAGTL